MVAAVSLLFFAVPMVLVERAREYAPDTSVAVVFALVPVIVVLAVNAFLLEEPEMRLLVPALAGFSGVLFLLPFELPVSARGWESVAELVTAMLFVGCAGVWLYGLLRQMGAVEGMAIAGAANATALVAWCGVRGQLDWRWSDVAMGVSIGSVGELVALALTVWLVRALDPVRFSARVLAIPLMTVIEGLVLLRPGVTGRTAVGILLLAIGTAWLLVGKVPEEAEALTIR
jgi:drug/metabolite transporter (DMT)-like permease